MTSHLNSRRRLLLFGILPVSLLMIAAPLSPHIAPQISETVHDINNRQVAVVSPVPSAVSLNSFDETAPRISPSAEKGMREGRRMVALDVISRLEEEARRKGGNTRLSALDLKRLRNALREPESTDVKNDGSRDLSAQRTELRPVPMPHSVLLTPVD